MNGGEEAAASSRTRPRPVAEVEQSKRRRVSVVEAVEQQQEQSTMLFSTAFPPNANELTVDETATGTSLATAVATPPTQTFPPRISMSPMQQVADRLRQQLLANKPPHSSSSPPRVTKPPPVKDPPLPKAPPTTPVATPRLVYFPPVGPPPRRTPHYPRIFTAIGLLLLVAVVRGWTTPRPERLHPHILLPRHVRATGHPKDILTKLTLRDVLTDPQGFHLAMAPAFFGFYGYFGALAAWESSIGRQVLGPTSIHSIAGASAGAMAAVLLSVGIPPRRAADFVAGMTVSRFADVPALGAVFRGNRFEAIMRDFLQAQVPGHSLQLQDAHLPVAVSAFDIQTMQGCILDTGHMARAARASATFPLLFQPVAWEDNNQNDYLLVDGGLRDWHGLRGLEPFLNTTTKARVINLVVGDFVGSPPGPSLLPTASGASVVSISIRNLPPCGPWAMANGPKAVEAASAAMLASLEVPLYRGHEENHYELHIDASSFWQ